MRLDYLVFDTSDEDSGRGSFDAMASVAPDRLPALLAEVAAVLRWAHGLFGPAGEQDPDAEWDCELTGIAEPGTPLEIAFDASSGQVSFSPSAPAALTTVTLTLGGSPSFAEAFRAQFGLDG